MTNADFVLDISDPSKKNKSYLIQFWDNGYKWTYIVKSPDVESALFKIADVNQQFGWNKIENIKKIEELE
jgi:hypothetical protein